VEIEQFLAMLRFHQRNRLDELQIDIQMGAKDERFCFTCKHQ
jgi:hypothetical protein